MMLHTSHWVSLRTTCQSCPTISDAKFDHLGKMLTITSLHFFFFLCDLQIICGADWHYDNILFPNNLLLKVLMIYDTCLNPLFHSGLQNEW